MNNKNKVSVLLLTLATFTAPSAFAADNGITKEDIKRLQVNAFTEEMQKEMEKSVRSELNSSIKTSDFEVKADVATGVTEEKIIPEAPAITSR